MKKELTISELNDFFTTVSGVKQLLPTLSEQIHSRVDAIFSEVNNDNLKEKIKLLSEVISSNEKILKEQQRVINRVTKEHEKRLKPSSEQLQLRSTQLQDELLSVMSELSELDSKSKTDLFHIDILKEQNRVSLVDSKLAKTFSSLAQLSLEVDKHAEYTEEALTPVVDRTQISPSKISPENLEKINKFKL